jgi:hypothetical protein
MSLVGIVNLAERLLNQNAPQGETAAGGPSAATGANAQATQGAAGEDQFTPSSQTGQTQTAAQDAGLFTVAQFSFFSAAADFLLGQNTAAPANPAANATAPANVAPPAPQTTFTPVGAAPQNLPNLAAQTQLTPAANAATAAGLPQNATVPATTGATGTANVLTNQAAAAPATAAAPTSQGSAATQQQLQSLNNALAALGLSPQDIQELDQIASVINDYSPSAYTALAYQLEQLAQQAAPQATQQAGANAAANAQTAPANANGATAAANGANTAGPNANAGGFQVKELVIKFAGVEAQGNTAAQGNANGGAVQPATGNANANNFQFAAFNLQIEQVNLTLVNDNGQTAQIQAPANPFASQARTKAAAA